MGTGRRSKRLASARNLGPHRLSGLVAVRTPKNQINYKDPGIDEPGPLTELSR